MIGNLVNFIAIIIGSLLGLVVGERFSEKAKETGLQGMGLVVIVLGIAMALETESFLIVILAVAFGGVLGEMIDIEGKTEKLGELLKEPLRERKRTHAMFLGKSARDLLRGEGGRWTRGQRPIVE